METQFQFPTDSPGKQVQIAPAQDENAAELIQAWSSKSAHAVSTPGDQVLKSKVRPACGAPSGSARDPPSPPWAVLPTPGTGSQLACSRAVAPGRSWEADAVDGMGHGSVQSGNGLHMFAAMSSPHILIVQGCSQVRRGARNIPPPFPSRASIISQSPTDDASRFTSIDCVDIPCGFHACMHPCPWLSRMRPLRSLS